MKPDDLVDAIRRLIKSGAFNPEVIKTADWIFGLTPEGGDEFVAAGKVSPFLVRSQ